MPDWFRRTTGVLALGGSALGCTVIATMFFSPQPFLAKVFLAIFFPIYAFGIWCGMQMLERHPDAVRTNLLFWAIQVPVVQSSWVSYLFSSGALAGAWLQFSPLELNFLGWFGSRFEMTINRPKPLSLGVNLVALSISIALWHLHRRRNAS